MRATKSIIFSKTFFCISHHFLFANSIIYFKVFFFPSFFFSCHYPLHSEIMPFEAGLKPIRERKPQRKRPSLSPMLHMWERNGRLWIWLRAAAGKVEPSFGIRLWQFQKEKKPFSIFKSYGAHILFPLTQYEREAWLSGFRLKLQLKVGWPEIVSCWLSWPN